MDDSVLRHGNIQVAGALQPEGVHGFAVSNIIEVHALRKAGIKSQILVLGHITADEADLFS